MGTCQQITDTHSLWIMRVALPHLQLSPFKAVLEALRCPLSIGVACVCSGVIVGLQLIFFFSSLFFHYQNIKVSFNLFFYFQFSHCFLIVIYFYLFD
jgi:hypothetical protein